MMGKSATLAACVVLFAVTMSSAAILRTGDILVVNSSTNGVYQIDPASGNRTVISSTAHGVGAGPALGVHQFGGEVAISPSGEIYVTNTGYYGAAGYVYRIDPTTGNRSILSGDGSLGSFGAGTSMYYPQGLAINGSGQLLVVNGSPTGHGVYQIDPATGNRTVISSTVYGVGTGPDLGILTEGGEVAVGLSGDIYVTNRSRYGTAGYVYRIDPATGNRSILSGDGSYGIFGAGTSMYVPEGLAVNESGQLLVLNGQSAYGVYEIDSTTGNRTVLSSTTHGVGSGPNLTVSPFGGEVEVGPSGDIYVTNSGYYGYRGYVYRIDPTTGNRSILSGDGSLGSFGAGTSMVYPEGLAVVPDSRVRKVEGGSPHPDGHTSSDSFGTVLVGAAAGNDAYSLTNTGQFVADAVVHAPTGDIAIAPGIYSLLPGESHALAFTFDTSTAGNKSGSLAVSNNRNLGDSDEVFNFSGTVLDHANASFDSATDLNTLTIDFGPLALSGTPAVLSAGISNLLATPGFTSSLDFDDITGLGHTGVLTTNLMPASGFLPGGAESFFDVFFDLSTLGSFSAEYTLLFSDQDLPGEATNSLTLLLTGSVFIPEPSTLTISTLGLLGLTFFGRRRRRRAA